MMTSFRFHTVHKVHLREVVVPSILLILCEGLHSNLATHCTTRLHDYTTPDPGLHSVIRLVRTSVGQDWDAGIFHSTNLSRWDWRKLLNLMINAMVFFQCSPYQQIHSFRDHVLEHSRVKLPWTWRHLADPVASSFDKSAQARHGKRTPEPQQ